MGCDPPPEHPAVQPSTSECAFHLSHVNQTWVWPNSLELKGTSAVREKIHLATFWRVALNLNWLDEGLSFKEQFVTVSESSNKANGIGRLKRQGAEPFASQSRK